MVLPEAAVLGLSCFRHLKYQKKKKNPSIITTNLVIFKKKNANLLPN